jgi:phenylpropionate dioxygenase-like ring-hydroxylating dioxygenase large terminal subunit
MSEAKAIQLKNRYQSFDSLNDSLKTILRTIPAHEEFVPPVVDYRRPASFFLGDEQYKLEQEKVFRRLPVVLTVSALLKEPNSVMANDSYGLPLLITRDKDGVVRVFLNVCQHKGALLVEDFEVHKQARITCPYHSWTYALNGRLAGVPREESFCKLDKSERGLVELPSKEVGGLIWAILDRNAEPDFSIVGSELQADLSGLDFADSYCYGRKTFDLKANWKLVMEPFLEAYHVRRLHAQTVGPMFQDVSGVQGTPDGYHFRQISGRGDFEPALLDQPVENIHKLITMTWQLIPSTVLIGSPYYLSVMIVIPQAPNRTRVDYHMLTRMPPDNEKADELYKKSYDMILNVFGNEDFRAAEISQKGLESGALEETIYCGMEEAIPRYYDILEKHLQA